MDANSDIRIGIAIRSLCLSQGFTLSAREVRASHAALLECKGLGRQFWGRKRVVQAYRSTRARARTWDSASVDVSLAILGGPRARPRLLQARTRPGDVGRYRVVPRSRSRNRTCSSFACNPPHGGRYLGQYPPPRPRTSWPPRWHGYSTPRRFRVCPYPRWHITRTQPTAPLPPAPEATPG